MIDHLEKDLRKNGPMKVEDMRPPLKGYDPIVSGLQTLTNQIISLRMDNGNSKVKHLPIPLFPMEMAEERVRTFAARKRMSAIEISQSKPKWKKAAANA